MFLSGVQNDMADLISLDVDQHHIVINIVQVFQQNRCLGQITCTCNIIQTCCEQGPASAFRQLSGLHPHELVLTRVVKGLFFARRCGVICNKVKGSSKWSLRCVRFIFAGRKRFCSPAFQSLYKFIIGKQKMQLMSVIFRYRQG